MLLFNPYIMCSIVNLAAVGLYLLQLSNLYNPDIFFVLYYLSPIIFLIMININGVLRKKDVLDSGCLKKINIKSYNKWVYVLFILGVLASIYQITVFGMPLSLENKVNRPIGDHYVQYLVNFLQIAASMSYVSWRLKFETNKWKCIVIILLSLAFLSVWLNRGAFTLFLLTIVIVEYLRAKMNSRLIRFYTKFAVASIIFIWLFNYVGNTRIEYVFTYIYGHTLNAHYGFTEDYPSWFIWIYIYASSSLENASLIWLNQDVFEYRLGANMLYPFIAPFFKDDLPHSVFFPPLDYSAGLNVSTYLPSSIEDFGYVGPYIYMLYLTLYYRIAVKSLDNDVYGLLCYISVLHMSLWMIFANPFAIGPNLIAVLFFMFLSWISRVKVL